MDPLSWSSFEQKQFHGERLDRIASSAVHVQLESEATKKLKHVDIRALVRYSAFVQLPDRPNSEAINRALSISFALVRQDPRKYFGG